MSPTNEQIMAEVRRRTTAVWGKGLEDTIIEVMREGWTPPEPVDPDVLAFREFASKEAKSASLAEAYLDGDMDSGASARLFLAGARMAREQERERAGPLAQYLQDRADRDDAEADRILAKYRGEA